MKRIIFLILLSCNLVGYGQGNIPLFFANNIVVVSSNPHIITIDHTKLGSTDCTNFDLTFYGTYSYLKTIANGGAVANASGYDIGFYSDAGYTTKLKWEIVAWNGSTGAVFYKVKIPTVSHTTNTDIYLGYGDAGITTDQSDRTGTYNANFLLMAHLEDGTTLSALDATSNANNGTISGATATTGLVGGAANFNGTTNNITWAGIMPGANFTLEMNFYPIASSDDYGSMLTEGDTRGIYYRGTSRKISYYDVGDHVSTTALTESTWHNLSIVGNSSGVTIYIDGAADGTFSFTPTTTINFDHMGDASGDSYKGKTDEVHISNVAHDASWVLARANNELSPSTFYTVH